jgi:sulfite reductase beta subunit-like hemoprotein
MANKLEEIKKQKDGLDVWPDLLRYAGDGYTSITPDDMSRLRWYGIYEQQPKEGHFMLRVKVPGGDIAAEQWRVLGEIARDHGRGIADVTTRQNVQFHWLTVETLPGVIDRLRQVDLTTIGACGDITRNICGCPVAGIDPDELYDCRELIRDVTAYFLGNREFSDLPRKFKITIAGCPVQCHMPEINDVGISAVRRITGGREEVGFEVRVGGGLSTQPYVSQRLDVFLRPDQVVDACRAITEIFRDDGYRERRNHARLKFLVADWGAERFRERFVEKLGWDPERAAPATEITGGRRDHVGIYAQKQPGYHWIGVTILTGRVTADQILAAADIADRFCGGALRTTGGQDLIFPNVPADGIAEAQGALADAGYRWDASPFRRSAISCTGSEFCNLAVTETKHRLAEIVGYLERELQWDEPIRIHLNGCPNSCGQHHIGDIGLQGCIAKVGDEKVEAFDVCLGGRLGSDAKFTRPIRRKVPASVVQVAIANLLRSYRAERADGENFSTFVDRHTDDELAAFLGADLLAPADAPAA